MLPLPRMGWAERGVWHSKLLMLLGVRCVCARLTMPPPSVPRSVTKYRASRDTRSLVRRKRPSASAGPAVDSDAERGLVPQNRVARQRRFQEEVADNPGRELLLDEIVDVPRLSAGSSRQVAGVARRLVQETHAGHGVGDVLRSRAVTILLSTRVPLSKDDRAEEMAELTWLLVW